MAELNTETGGGLEITPLAEKTQDFSTYEAAAKAACAHVESGKVKVDRSKLRIYISTVGPMQGRVVGVGKLNDSKVIEDIVRLDNDDAGKGIHFNAKNISIKKGDPADKLAARLVNTVSMTKNARYALYLDYLKALENLQADTLWDWWRTGKKPTSLQAAEDIGKAEQGDTA